jgi:hypothetical protein
MLSIPVPTIIREPCLAVVGACILRDVIWISFSQTLPLYMRNLLELGNECTTRVTGSLGGCGPISLKLNLNQGRQLEYKLSHEWLGKHRIDQMLEKRHREEQASQPLHSWMVICHSTTRRGRQYLGAGGVLSMDLNCNLTRNEPYCH